MLIPQWLLLLLFGLWTEWETLGQKILLFYVNRLSEVARIKWSGSLLVLAGINQKFQVGFTLVFNSVNILSENIKEIGLNFVQLLKNQTEIKKKYKENQRTESH